jgi:hypothetical protein
VSDPSPKPAHASVDAFVGVKYFLDLVDVSLLDFLTEQRSKIGDRSKNAGKMHGDRESCHPTARPSHCDNRPVLPARRVSTLPGGFCMCSGLETLPLSTKGDPVLSLTTASSCSFEQPIRIIPAMTAAAAIGRILTVAGVLESRLQLA